MSWFKWFRRKNISYVDEIQIEINRLTVLLNECKTYGDISNLKIQIRTSMKLYEDDKKWESFISKVQQKENDVLHTD